ncbi:MAG: hypothetical protein JSV80_11580, partial [Acidobacteriota bacterium]
AAAADVPVLRKDFLVDPYQVYEARVAGAGGVLLILRLLDEETLDAMLDAAEQADLFVVLEAFSKQELARARHRVESGNKLPCTLVGYNARDLASLETDATRFAQALPHFPPGAARVAESALTDAASVSRVAGLGYELALVGTALMKAVEPERELAAMIEAGRRARSARRDGTCACA